MRYDARGAVRILESCFAAIANQDADRLVAHYTEDYVIEFPYWKPMQTRVVEGREAVRRYLAHRLAGQRMQLRLETHHWIADEELLIAEYASRSELLDTGELYRNRYVGYWFFEGEHVCRTREYYNPEARLAAAIN